MVPEAAPPPLLQCPSILCIRTEDSLRVTHCQGCCWASTSSPALPSLPIFAGRKLQLLRLRSSVIDSLLGHVAFWYSQHVGCVDSTSSPGSTCTADLFYMLLCGPRGRKTHTQKQNQDKKRFGIACVLRSSFVLPHLSFAAYGCSFVSFFTSLGCACP